MLQRMKNITNAPLNFMSGAKYFKDWEQARGASYQAQHAHQTDRPRAQGHGTSGNRPDCGGRREDSCHPFAAMLHWSQH